MIGSIISAGANLLGSIFGSKKQKVENTVDYVAMARNAEAAGFNPLTALRNGGSAGFTTTISHPGLSGMADAVSQIGGQLGSALEKKIDPIEQKRSKVENALLDYQLATIQSQPKSPMMFGDVPSRSSSGKVTQHAAPLGAKKVAAPPTNIVPGDAPTASSVGLEDRWGWHVDPLTADASAWEQRYGEPGEWIGGAYVMTADALHNADRKLQSLQLEGKVKDKAGKTAWDRSYEKGKPLRDWLSNTFSGSGFKDVPALKGGRVAPKTSW